ncbi:MAG: hypothetical protein ACP5P9_03285, partial [Acidimicrobiales bacterium]
MHWSPLDERTADALLDGRVSASDLPRSLHPLREVIRQASTPVGRAPLPGEEELVRAFAAAVGTPPGISLSPTRRKPMLARLLTLKAAAAAAAVLFGGGVAAAATGTLPGPMQTVAAHSLASVGWSVPDPGHSPHGQGAGSTTAPPSSTTTVPSTTTKPSVVNSSNLAGLCTAYDASTRGGTETSKPNLGSTAFSDLSAAATAKGESVTTLCAGVSAGSSSTSSTTTQPTEPTQATLPPQATEHSQATLPPQATKHSQATLPPQATKHSGDGSSSSSDGGDSSPG